MSDVLQVHIYKCVGRELEAVLCSDGKVFISARSLADVTGYTEGRIKDITRTIRNHTDVMSRKLEIGEKEKRKHNPVCINVEYIVKPVFQCLRTHLQNQEREYHYEPIIETIALIMQELLPPTSRDIPVSIEEPEPAEDPIDEIVEPIIVEVIEEPVVETARDQVHAVRPSVDPSIVTSVERDNDDPNIVSLEDGAERFVKALLQTVRKQDAKLQKNEDSILNTMNVVSELTTVVQNLLIDVANLVGNTRQSVSQWDPTIKTPEFTTTTYPENAPYTTINTCEWVAHDELIMSLTSSIIDNSPNTIKTFKEYIYDSMDVARKLNLYPCINNKPSDEIKPFAKVIQYFAAMKGWIDVKEYGDIACSPGYAIQIPIPGEKNMYIKQLYTLDGVMELQKAISDFFTLDSYEKGLFKITNNKQRNPNPTKLVLQTENIKAAMPDAKLGERNHTIDLLTSGRLARLLVSRGILKVNTLHANTLSKIEDVNNWDSYQPNKIPYEVIF